VPEARQGALDPEVALPAREQAPRTLHVRAAAKINLALFVGPRRDDGYHEIVSVMQSAALWDELWVSSAGEGLELTVEGGGLPAGEGNLVLVAARELARRVRDRPGVRFRLRKGIPVAAGLGGGSADGAAAMLALDRLWGLGLPPANLRAMAAEVGSDVPFCLTGGTQLATGRGERLEAVDQRRALWWLLGIDAGGLASGDVYRRHDELGGAGPVRRERADALVAALQDGAVERVAAALANDLEPAAFSLRPELADARRRMLAAGAVGAVMSGSGPTMLGLCRDQGHAERLAQAVVGGFARVEVARAPVPGVTFG
jgi:4-diphosphocytidyl-2-C-methyl-D-erythritol kinase